MVKFVVQTTNRRRFWWPIKVRMPNEDPNRAGQFVEYQFKAQFEAMQRDESRKIFDDIMALPDDERPVRQDDVILKSVKGWDDSILDETKEPIAFSEEMLTSILQDPWVQAAFWRAWGEALAGDGGRKGN